MSVLGLSVLLLPDIQKEGHKSALPVMFCVKNKSDDMGKATLMATGTQ